MASLPVIKPLDGGDGYLRWRETLLLHLNTVGVAHVLSEDPPPSGKGGASPPPLAAVRRRRWARDDAVCRGHILSALSDRLLPVYAHFATAPELWRAVARTYDLAAAADSISFRRFNRFEFDDGAPVLEQLAHLQALAACFREPEFGAELVAGVIRDKLPAHARFPASAAGDKGGSLTMDMVWEEARIKEEVRMARIEDDIWEEMLFACNPEVHACLNCRQTGHVRKNCTRPARR